MGPFREGWQRSDVEAVLQRGDPSELLYVPIVISMDPPECEWATSICVRLSPHDDPSVRANAVLGVAHFVRTCSELDREMVQPLGSTPLALVGCATGEAH
jgi:hypothetical protein